MKSLFLAVLVLSSFSTFAADCVFHTTNYDGMVISQNSIYEAESKSVVDKRSGVKIDFSNDSDFKVIVSDLKGSKLYEKTFSGSFVDGKTETIDLGNNLYLTGKCSSDLFKLTNVIDGKEWGRRASLEAQCMGRSKKSDLKDELMACEKKLEASNEAKKNIVDTSARDAKAIEIFLDKKAPAASAVSK
jgi:hypothetical protein